MEVVSVPVILIICYVFAEIFKVIFKEKEKLFTRESSQQEKEERKIFLGFLKRTQKQENKKTKRN